MFKRILITVFACVLLAAVPGTEKEDGISIFFLGDSITTGAGLSGGDKTFADLTGEMLLKHNFTANIRNVGISGEKSDGALARLQKDVISQHPDVVVVMYGTNDAFVDEGKTVERLPLNDYKRNLSNIVRQLMDENIQVILMTPVPLGNNPALEREPYSTKGLDFYLKPYVSACREIAENHQVMLADNFLLWEEKKRLGKNMDDLLPDGKHPNANGHAEIAGILFPKALQACMNLKESRIIVRDEEYNSAHFQADLRPKGGFLEISGVFGYFYANYLPGKGDFKIAARFRIEQFNQAEPAFVLGDSQFSFFEEGRSLSISGLFSGYRNVFIRLDSAGIDPRNWMEFILKRSRISIDLIINEKKIFECFYQEEFSGKTGFKPGRAKIQVSRFSLEGNLTEVSTIPRSFTIPVVDISNDSAKQVIVDREPGQYLGHPTTALLEDQKTMFVVYPKGHGGGALVLKKSEDAGLTWSDRLAVPENWSGSKEVPTIYRSVDRQGNRRLIIFSGLYPIRMTFSDDDGKTWSPLQPVFSYGGIVTMSDMGRRANGDYVVFFHDDGKYYQREGKKTNKFFVFRSLSSDGGLTWSDPQVVTYHKSAHLCEGGLIVSPDGKEWALLLRENSRNYNSMIIFSRDEGETWTAPVELPASLTGDRHQLLYAPDGRIVAVFRDMAGLSPTRGDFVGWVGAWDDLKNGGEGQCRIRLLDNKVAYDCGYPGLELLPGGAFAATTYGHWQEGELPYIMSVRFTLDDIDLMLEK
ncbi:MAG: exo-alpha-sialidase [Bacteroidales bacterium]|nr:exo-alpha-sialidase [Bacteroidales bacterium]